MEGEGKKGREGRKGPSHLTVKAWLPLCPKGYGVSGRLGLKRVHGVQIPFSVQNTI